MGQANWKNFFFENFLSYKIVKNYSGFLTKKFFHQMTCGDFNC